MYRYDYEKDKIDENTLMSINEDIIVYCKYFGNTGYNEPRLMRRNGMALMSFLQCLTDDLYDPSVTYEGVDGRGLLLNEGQ